MCKLNSVYNVATNAVSMGFIRVARTKTGLKCGSIYEGLPLGDGMLARDFCYEFKGHTCIFLSLFNIYLLIWLPGLHCGLQCVNS